MKKFSYLIKNKSGISTIFFAFLLTVAAACAAITIDIGTVVFEKAKLSSTVDSAALAGAQELVTDINNVENIVNKYISLNENEVKNTHISINEDMRTVEVNSEKNVDMYFAKIFGINSEDVTCSATSKVENITTVTGSRPLAVVQQDFEYGRQYTLKEGGGDGYTGNYAAISLGGDLGAASYGENMLNGYDGTISVGDIIETEPGNMAGDTAEAIEHLLSECTHTPECTYLSYNKHCSKIIFIPVVNSLEVKGRKCVEVLGFATFFLEGVTEHSGQADVVGRFITYCMEGETSSQINDYGTYGIKLIK